MELEKAIQTFLDACDGARPVPIEEFVNASQIIVTAMSKEFTTSQVAKWCIAHRHKGEENDR